MSQRASRSDGDVLAAIRAQAEPFLRTLFGDFFAHGLLGFIEVRTIAVALPRPCARA